MAYYVFALVDARPAGRPGRGLGGAVAARAVPGGFAIVERRDDVPPAEFGTLKQHDLVVGRIAAAVPAILPVRFGTLLEIADIEEALADRAEELAEAFDRVRGRAQFTWRRGRLRRRQGSPVAPAAGTAASAPGAGTAYLRQAARAASPPPPSAFRALRDKLRRLIAAERYQPATPTLPDTLYHLVDRSDAPRYRLIAARLAAASPALNVTGPWAPFAFTPDLL